jgi:5,10-methylenetetrahydromethanopterin reductase
MTRFFLRSYAFPDEVEAAAVEAQSDGWDGLLFQDSQNLTPDITVSMTLAARATDHLLIGTAVTNLVTRNPAVVASMFATLNHVSRGRALLGVARGDTALHLVGQQAPSADGFAELLDHVHAYLAGGSVRIGELDSHLAWLPDLSVAPVPVNVFASGPRNLAVAASHGDLVTMTLGAEPDQVAWGLAQVRAVNATIPVGALIVAGVGDDVAALRQLVRANASISAHFRRDAGAALDPADAGVVSAVTRDYSDYGHATATSAQAADLPDDFLERFCVIGEPAQCVAHLRALIDLGLDHVVILGGGRDTDPVVRHRSDELFAREVLPALR